MINEEAALLLKPNFIGNQFINYGLDKFKNKGVNHIIPKQENTINQFTNKYNVANARQYGRTKDLFANERNGYENSIKY